MLRHLFLLVMACACGLFGYAQAGTGLASRLIETAAAHKTEAVYTVYLLQADSVAAINDDIATRALANEKLAFYYFSRNADKSIDYYKHAIDFYTAAGDRKKTAICVQNLAFVYDEGKHDNTKALQQAKEALRLWAIQGEKMQQANIYKYIGLLQGRTGQFAAAKESIDNAVSSFTAQGYEPGVAVSYFDLANILLEQKDPSGALSYLEKAKTIWRTHEDTGRIYVVNTAMVRALALTGDAPAAKTIIEENVMIEQKQDIYWSNRLEFYQQALAYDTHIKNEQQARIFEIKYESLNDSLNKKGITTR